MASLFRKGPGDKYPWAPHDPDAVLDYYVPLGDWLGANVLASATWTLAAGLVLEDDSINASPLTLPDPETGEDVVHPANTVCIVWISGGTRGARHLCSVHFVDNESPIAREDDRSFYLVITDK